MKTDKKFRTGQIVLFKPKLPNQWGARPGARAKVVGQTLTDLVVEWIRDEKSGGQMNGGYLKTDFTLFDSDWDV